MLFKSGVPNAHACALGWKSAITAMLVLFVASPIMQTRGTPERFTAMAVNIGGAPVRWTTQTVQIVVNRWSTEAERNRLLSVLREQGPEKLLDVLRDMPRVGYIRTPDSIGYDLRYSQRTPGEDGGERFGSSPTATSACGRR
jgi:hypothetical protein